MAREGKQAQYRVGASLQNKTKQGEAEGGWTQKQDTATAPYLTNSNSKASSTGPSLGLQHIFWDIKREIVCPAERSFVHHAGPLVRSLNHDQSNIAKARNCCSALIELHETRHGQQKRDTAWRRRSAFVSLVACSMR